MIPNPGITGGGDGHSWGVWLSTIYVDDTQARVVALDGPSLEVATSQFPLRILSWDDSRVVVDGSDIPPGHRWVAIFDESGQVVREQAL